MPSQVHVCGTLAFAQWPPLRLTDHACDSICAQAEVTLHPQTMNKCLHDTYLQRGALRSHGEGASDAEGNFELVRCSEIPAERCKSPSLKKY